jgi:hypothetical protein
VTTSFDFSVPGSEAFVAAEESTTVSPTSTDLVENTQHADEAISHLIEFFRSGPRNQAVLRAVGAQIQELETAFWALYTQRHIDTAVGAQLDILGRIVGELRDDRADADYRAAIRVRILVNSSDGKAEQLIAIVRGVSPSATVALTENYPAALRITVSTLGSATLRTLATLIQQAKPAGVRLQLSAGTPTVGAVDGTPAGGIVGAVDGTPAGFVVAGGT